MNSTKWISLLSVLVWLNPINIAHAQPPCESAHQTYRKVQQQMRKGQSAVSMARLQERERKAWFAWQRCLENPSVNKRSKRKAKQQSQPSSTKNRKQTNKITQSNYPKVLSNKPLNMKGAFSGDKQQAWLDFYQKPKECLKPKSTQQFAYCIEHARNAQLVFSQSYDENH